MSPAKPKAAVAEPAPLESDIPLGLQFVQEPPAPKHLNMVLYGPTGGGKSTAAATAPGPILWLNADGPNALAFARKTARKTNKPIFEVRVEPGQDVRQVLRDVIKHVKGDTVPRVETVVVDTIGKVREGLIGQLVVPGSRNSMQQFGEVAKALGGFVRVMRDLPVNLIILAHEDIADEDGERIVRPQIGGVLTETIPGEADIVAYCVAHREDDGIRYLGQLVEGRGRRAKDRSGGLGTIRPLDLTEWISAFQAALTEELPWNEPEPDDEPDEDDDGIDHQVDEDSAEHLHEREQIELGEAA